jgi:hypothetical protein
VSLTSSQYHYSSFSELPYLLYSKNSPIFCANFFEEKTLVSLRLVAKTHFCEAKTKPRLTFSKKAPYRLLGKYPVSKPKTKFFP